MSKTLAVFITSALLSFKPVAASERDAISTDIFIGVTPSTVIADNAIAEINEVNSIIRINNIGLPASADIAALHYVDESTLLFTLKSSAQLGSIRVHAGDVIQWDNGTFTLYTSKASLGLSTVTGIDALTLDGDALVFSTNIATTVNGIAVSDSDLLSWSDGAPTSLLLDESECGIPAEADLAALHRLDGGDFLMSFSSSTTILGVNARRGDIMRCDPVSNDVNLYRRFSDLGNNWATVRIDALSRLVIPYIFKDGFEY